LVAAQAPDPLTNAAVTTNDGTNVKIAWTLPADNGGVAITAYTIEIQQVGAAGWNADSACVGSDPTTRANLYCVVAMSSLTAAPHSLVRGNLVVVRVTVTNSIGTSATSTPNSGGATIMTVPDVPGTASRDGAGTTDTQITVNFPVPSQDGGSPLLSLELQWDAGSTGGTWTSLTGLAPNQLSTTFVVSTALL
jgi:hypothetical protein